jgi:hypothetical protein
MICLRFIKKHGKSYGLNTKNMKTSLRFKVYLNEDGTIPRLDHSLSGVSLSLSLSLSISLSLFLSRNGVARLHGE